jgi:peptidoglycan/LPS O-acetylase OafA/YrhL
LTRLSWQAGVLRAIPGFAFGVWLCLHADRIDRMLPPAIASGLVASLAGLLAILLLLPISQYATLALVWVLVAAAYRCDRAGRGTPFSAPWLANRGELTYSLYMLHPVLATILLAVLFPKLLGTTLAARWLAVGLTLPLLYVVAAASLRWFERPARNAINAWSMRLMANDEPIRSRHKA